jgi:hypothetical integral membrane protein (TIGR02206 family)
LDDFTPFSAMHALVVVAFAAVTTAAVLLGRRYRFSPGRLLVERFVGCSSLLLFVAINQELWLHTERFEAKRSLPLHVCDLTLLLIPLVLAFNWRPARVILYYFGLGLSTQGFITPDLHEGPAHWPFWSFWLLHFIVVGTAIYDVAARGFRPTWKDLRFAMMVSIGYVAILLPIDAMFGWNYGYVGPSKPEQPSLIDVLGPWPWRVPLMVGMGFVVFTLMTLPWEVVRRRTALRGGTSP